MTARYSSGQANRWYRMKRANIITGIVFIVLSIFIFIQSSNFQQTMITDNFVGAAFFPRVIASIMVVLSLILILGSVLDRNQKSVTTIFKIANMRMPFIVFIIIFIYTVLLDKLGFIVATILLNLVIFTILKYENRLLTLILSFGITLVIYQVFQKMLMVPLPSGIFGF